MKFLLQIVDWIDRNIWKKTWVWFTYYPVLVLVAVVVLAIYYWDQLSTWESESATIGNLAFVVFAVIGLALAIWRGAVADRQADTAQQSLLNERYQKGAEMLGSDLLSVRLAGIYALGSLRREHPKRYHVQVMQLLCGFVCHPPKHDRNRATDSESAREDIRAAMQALGDRKVTDITLEHAAGYVPNLEGANLQKQRLHDLNLSGVRFGPADPRTLLSPANLSGASFLKTSLRDANLWDADLSETRIMSANFCGATLINANLSGISMAISADFSKANMSGANLTDANFCGSILTDAVLSGANVSGTIFTGKPVPAKGLTQEQVASAEANPEDKPPILDGLTDADTDELIEWS